MKTKATSIGIATVIVFILFSIVWVPLFGPHRPYVNWAPWDLAEYLVKNDRPAKECFDLIWFEIMSPTQSEQRALCVHEYAELKKDPSACELLMPSSYGLDCIGSASDFLDACSMSYEYVSWEGGRESYSSCAKNNKTRSAEANQCCTIAKVAFVFSENDCSSLQVNVEVYDECLQSLAFKNHSPEICEEITNENRQKACEINAQAIQENPAICSGCKERVKTLQDFK